MKFTGNNTQGIISSQKNDYFYFYLNINEVKAINLEFFKVMYSPA